MKDQSNFIKTIMENDLESKKHDLIITRFPPEPNGFLHIGHARAIVINFELAKHFNGYTNLRYDDTNPVGEEQVYIDAILEDVKWLGYEPKDILFASNYFEEMYNRAILLVKKGLAYVDESSAEVIQEERGNVTTPGINSKYRNRPIEESLKLFIQMRNGEIEEGKAVLRAKIDMSSPNMNMRDPIIYRIMFETHLNTKDKWPIYPMYDYAHPLEDAIEGITHSLCSLEFEDHRPLYDWFVEHTEMPKVPRQIEFGRLNIEKTVMSKRYLKQLVDSGKVTGWDDPRMPTLSGLRRRGYTKEAIKSFILSAGLSKVNSTISSDMLEAALRDDLANKAKRVFGIIDPIKVTITNYDKDQVEWIDVPYFRDDEEMGSRKIAFGKELYIEREDFVLEKPNKHYKRLALGLEVRLFHAYFIKANDVVYDNEGNIIEILATYDEATLSGSGFDERKPNGTIQFVEASTALKAKFNYFEPMLVSDDSDISFMDRFNEESWIVKKGFVEGSLKDTVSQDKYQLIRTGYFNVDDESTRDDLIFNLIVPLRSSYK